MHVCVVCEVYVCVYVCVFEMYIKGSEYITPKYTTVA